MKEADLIRLLGEGEAAQWEIRVVQSAAQARRANSEWLLFMAIVLFFSGGLIWQWVRNGAKIEGAGSIAMLVAIAMVAVYSLRSIVGHLRDRRGRSTFVRGALGKPRLSTNAAHRRITATSEQEVANVTLDVEGCRIPAEVGTEVIVEYQPTSRRPLAVAYRRAEPEGGAVTKGPEQL